MDHTQHKKFAFTQMIEPSNEKLLWRTFKGGYFVLNGALARRTEGVYIYRKHNNLSLQGEVVVLRLVDIRVRVKH